MSLLGLHLGEPHGRIDARGDTDTVAGNDTAFFIDFEHALAVQKGVFHCAGLEALGLAHRFAHSVMDGAGLFLGLELFHHTGELLHALSQLALLALERGDTGLDTAFDQFVELVLIQLARGRSFQFRNAVQGRQHVLDLTIAEQAETLTDGLVVIPFLGERTLQTVDVRLRLHAFHLEFELTVLLHILFLDVFGKVVDRIKNRFESHAPSPSQMPLMWRVADHTIVINTCSGPVQRHGMRQRASVQAPEGLIRLRCDERTCPVPIHRRGTALPSLRPSLRPGTQRTDP